MTAPESRFPNPEDDPFQDWADPGLLVMRSHAVDLVRPTHTRCGLTGQHYQVFLSADPDPKTIDCPECRHAVNHQRLAEPPPLERWSRSAPPYGLIGISIFGISGFAFTFVFPQAVSVLLALATTAAVLWWAKEQDTRQ